MTPYVLVVDDEADLLTGHARVFDAAHEIIKLGLNMGDGGLGRLGREFAEVDLRRLVGAVLGPHDREDAQFDVIGRSPQTVKDDLIFSGRQAVFGGQFGHGFRCAHGWRF